MKKMTRILVATLLVITSIFAFSACNKKPAAGKLAKDVPYEFDAAKYGEESDKVYDNAFGEFYTNYQEALKQEDINVRFALMAVAEAKLMESAAYLPTSSRGGTYAISRVVPQTITDVLWGQDSDRYHQAIVATEPITVVDRDAMKAVYAAHRADTSKTAKDYENAIKAQFFGEGKYTLKDSYTIGYVTEPETWDVLATSKQPDSAVMVNTYDGLMEYDILGRLQPAMAESYTLSDDKLTYTFKIREGQQWVDAQGKKVADFKADDFVAGFQHMLDVKGGLEYLVDGLVKNAHEYLNGKVLFEEVGIKADATANTVSFTLTKPAHYFLTMLGYSPFAPMSRTFYESKGGKFGADFDATVEEYMYGKGADSIAYCGPYRVTNHTEKNKFIFSANESYWNKDNINVKTITWLYNDGKDATKAYKDMISGTIDGCGLNTQAIELAKKEKDFEAKGTEKSNFAVYAYVTATDATAFGSFVNLNRKTFANFNDKTAAQSTQTVKQAENTNKAVQNAHFRRAIAMALDRASYNAQQVGEELKLNSIANSYTPGKFVSITDDVTIKINGTDKTFPAGTFYGAIMQAQIDADDIKIKVWDKDADGGIGSSAGFDGWYNPAEAVKELDKAIAELGFEITAENPIVLDLPYPSSVSDFAKKANAYKQSVEKSLGGKVIINLVDVIDYDGFGNAGFKVNPGQGYNVNYDLYDFSGWGPDYGDPQTYLDTMLPEDGYMIHSCGIY